MMIFDDPFKPNPLHLERRTSGLMADIKRAYAEGDDKTARLLSEILTLTVQVYTLNAQNDAMVRHLANAVALARPPSIYKAADLPDKRSS